ncbi:hypothetical protein NW768_010773 [Fusarium equiseti]|uniref:E3 ubiquitin-protein ligase hace1 n=1 Tax=Fusarium equiseti TaxID=61235 RepID=A0ABQ8QZF8_FUSEQ|nr:hypothetical protein NW768_010773 [Fusarium equiseti]
MAEPASAILSFVVAGLATWKRIEKIINSAKNAPRNARHWRVVGGVLTQSLTVMQKRIGVREAVLTKTEVNLFEAINKFTNDFESDLLILEETIHTASRSNRYWNALRQPSGTDQDLFERLSRNVQIFQLSAQALQLLDPPHAVSGHGVKDLLEGISEENLRVNLTERVNIDEEPDLRSWREAIEDVADAAAQSEFPDPIADIPAIATPNAPNSDEIPRRLSGITAKELRYRFDAAILRAERMHNAGIPRIAKRQYDKAMKYKERMDESTMSDVDLVGLEISYIKILNACEPHDKSCEALAFERLQNLKTQILGQAGSNDGLQLRTEQIEAVGFLCIELRDRKGAIKLLRSSLDGYLSKPDEFKEKIRLISRVICEQYGYEGKWHKLDAFRKILFEELQYDPTSERSTLERTIAWCHQHGFQAMEDEGSLFIPKENFANTTPLHKAATDTKIPPDVVRQLMLAVEHAIQDKDGDTPLLVAVQYSNDTALRELLQVTDSVHVWNAKGQTPLHLCENEATLKLLLNEIQRPIPRSPSEERRVEFVHIDSLDAYGSTALHQACDKGDLGMARLLIEGGADVNLVSGLNETPLMITCAPSESKGKGKLNKDRQQILEMLVNHNADTMCEDSRGKPAVHNSLRMRMYSKVEIDIMLSQDPAWRFNRSWGKGRNSQSSAATGATMSPVELAADTSTGPFELEATNGGVLTPPSSCDESVHLASSSSGPQVDEVEWSMSGAIPDAPSEAPQPSGQKCLAKEKGGFIQKMKRRGTSRLKQRHQ